jgi:hypothetical protein
MRLAGHVALMRKKRNVYMVLLGILKERDKSEDLCIDGRKGSKWILGRLAGGVWIGFDWLRTGTGGKLS